MRPPRPARSRSVLRLERLDDRVVPAVGIDPTFSNGGQATAHFGFGDDSTQALVVQPDGKIVLAGYALVGGDTDFAVVRLNANGTRDTSFGTNGRVTVDVAGIAGSTSTNDDFAYAVTLDSGGRILVAGTAKIGTDYDFAVVRLNANGTRDTSFSGDGIATYDFAGSSTASLNDDTAYGIAVQPGTNQIIVGGTAYIAGDDDFAAIRLNTNGTRDTGFNGGAGRNTIHFGSGDDSAFGMAVRPNGKIVLSGTALIGPDKDFAIAQLNANGTTDTAFGSGGSGRRTVDVSGASGTSGGNDAAYTMTLLPSGAAVLVGKARIGPDDDFAILKFTSSGGLDTSFGGGDGIALHDFAGTNNQNGNLANDSAFGVATDPSGGFVVVGRAKVGRDFDFAVVRYTAAGVLDPNFGSGGDYTTDFELEDDSAFAVTVQPDGRIVVAGEAGIGGDLDFAAVRLNSVTSTSPPPASNRDTDGDGLLDSWETSGIDANGDGTIDLDLPALGADPNVPDVFVEVDAMVGLAPAQAALDRVAAAFAAHNIRLHSIVGDTNIPRADWPELQNNFPVGFLQARAQFLGTAAERASANWPNIRAARELAFRYCIFAQRYGNTSSSGVAQGIPAQNFTVTYPGASVDAQAGTYMHEMGHTLGLRHHGGDNTPNPSDDYVSIMNYKFQFGTSPNRVANHPNYSESADPYPDWQRLRYNWRTGAGASAGLDADKAPTNGETDLAPVVLRAVVVGAGPNGTAQVFAPAGGGQYGPPAGVNPFGPLPVSVRTATGDVDGDGTADTILVTGPGTGIRVAVVSGADNGTVLVAPFDPFGGNFPGGGYVSAADLDGNGRAEFVVTPDEGGGPRVTVFTLNPDGSTATLANFLGIDDVNFRGGARAALGDVNGDGTPDVVVAAGFGGGPRTAIFTGQSVLGGAPVRLVADFFAFPGSDAINLRNGSFVATGDVTGDGFADLVFGGGPGGAPRVFILSGAMVSAGDVAGAQGTPVANFFVGGDLNDRGGARVAVTNSDGDTRADVVIGSGAGRPARVRVYLGANVTGGGEPGGAVDLSVLGGAVLADGVYVG
ncbi:VCBS repeat-containing protein [bacterium]|nr:VCBS repeat-containing protein [bacterium]